MYLGTNAMKKVLMLNQLFDDAKENNKAVVGLFVEDGSHYEVTVKYRKTGIRGAPLKVYHPSIDET